MIITLEQDEITICHVLGRMRSLIARASHVKDAKMGKQDGAEADVLGFAGEYAFAKQFNTFPDIGLSPRSGSADGVFKNLRYDIKSTNLPNGRLLCTLKENTDVDIYVLAIVNLPTVNIVGWVYSKELRLEKNLKDLGHGNGYVLDQSQLRKFKND
jgi:hypothetical protein